MRNIIIRNIKICLALEIPFWEKKCPFSKSVIPALISPSCPILPHNRNGSLSCMCWTALSNCNLTSAWRFLGGTNLGDTGDSPTNHGHGHQPNHEHIYPRHQPAKPFRIPHTKVQKVGGLLLCMTLSIQDCIKKPGQDRRASKEFRGIVTPGWFFSPEMPLPRTFAKKKIIPTISRGSRKSGIDHLRCVLFSVKKWPTFRLQPKKLSNSISHGCPGHKALWDARGFPVPTTTGILQNLLQSFTQNPKKPEFPM